MEKSNVIRFMLYEILPLHYDLCQFMADWRCPWSFSALSTFVIFLSLHFTSIGTEIDGKG